MQNAEELRPREGFQRALAAAGLALAALALLLQARSQASGLLRAPFWLAARAKPGESVLLARYDPSRRDLRWVVVPPKLSAGEGREPGPAAAALLEPGAPCLSLSIERFLPGDWPESAAALASYRPTTAEVLRSAWGRGPAPGGLGPYGRLLLALEALALPAGQRPVALLPGTAGRKGAYLPDEGLLRALRERYLNLDAPPAGRLTVEVLNGSGTEGLALKVTDALRKQGLDVVNWGNAAGTLEHTRVFDRQGDRRAALKLKAALGLDAPAVTELQTWSQADATLVLGADYKGPGRP